jgi:hypothetical protein
MEWMVVTAEAVVVEAVVLPRVSWNALCKIVRRCCLSQNQFRRIVLAI